MACVRLQNPELIANLLQGFLPTKYGVKNAPGDPKPPS